MAYYMLNKCSPDKLDDIAELCKRGGLEERMCTIYNPEARQWDKGRGGEILVKYDPKFDEEAPLMVQTLGTIKVDDPDVLALVKRLIQITGTSEVYDDRVTAYRNKYPDSLFE